MSKNATATTATATANAEDAKIVSETNQPQAQVQAKPQAQAQAQAKPVKPGWFRTALPYIAAVATGLLGAGAGYYTGRRNTMKAMAALPAPSTSGSDMKA